MHEDNIAAVMDLAPELSQLPSPSQRPQRLLVNEDRIRITAFVAMLRELRAEESRPEPPPPFRRRFEEYLEAELENHAQRSPEVSRTSDDPAAPRLRLVSSR